MFRGVYNASLKLDGYMETDYYKWESSENVCTIKTVVEV